HPLPDMQPFDGRFENGRLTAVGQLPTDFTADQYVCLPLQFVPSQDVTGELKVNASGANAILATANQRTVVAAGETLTAYPLLRIEAGSPPRAYPVNVRVYDEQIAAYGYDVLNAEGMPIGKDLS